MIIRIFCIILIGTVTAKGILTYKQNIKLNKEEIRVISKEADGSIKEEYSNYSTKEEDEENIRKINEKKLHSDRFKETKDFVYLMKGKNGIREKTI